MFRKDSDLEMALRADLVVVHNIETLDKIMRYIDRQRTAVAIIQHGPTTSTYQNATNFDPNMTVTEAKEYPIVNKIHQKELGFYKTVDFIICPCPEAMEAYSDFYPEWNSIMKDKMAICLTGTHRPQIINSREEWRKKLNIPETAVMAVYIGRYHPHKGFDILMQAVELAQKKIDKEFYLVCAGGRDAGQKKIKNVLHIGYTNDVGGLLNASDFMINSNKYSFFDLSILEALSLSKPILLTDAGGNKEIKRLIPEIEMVKTNALDLADGIIKMINKNLNADTGAISEKYKKHFSPSAFVENHEKLYDFIFQKFSKK
jgi:glycosyltransferase involved in cell wall biosynthesis